MSNQVDLPESYARAGDVTGKRVVITGASRGLGRAARPRLLARRRPGRARGPHRGRPQGAWPTSCPGPSLVRPGRRSPTRTSTRRSPTPPSPSGAGSTCGSATPASPRSSPGPARPIRVGLARDPRRQPHRRVPRRPRRGPGDGRRAGASSSPARCSASARARASPRTARRRPDWSGWPRRWRSTSRPPASPSTSSRPGGSTRRWSSRGSTTPSSAPGVLAHTALERWGAPADLVGAYQFLASDASAFVTGTVLTVDGGYLLV